MNVPAARPVFTTAYENFKGVDFTSQRPDRNRFPEACNIEITDHVKKRPGYGRISIKCGGEEITDEIKVIKFMKFNNEPYYFVQAGNVLYRGKDFDSMEEVKTNSQVITSDEAMNFVECDNKVYVLTGRDIYEISYKEDILSDEGIKNGTGKVYDFYYKNGEIYYLCTDKNGHYGNAEYSNIYYKIVTEADFPVFANRFIGADKKIPSDLLKIKEDSEGIRRPHLCYIDVKKSSNFPYLSPQDGGFAYAPCFAENVDNTIKGQETAAEYARVFSENVLNEEINILTPYRFCEYNAISAPGGGNSYILPEDYLARTIVIVRGLFKDNDNSGNEYERDYIEIESSGVEGSSIRYIKSDKINGVYNGQKIRIYYESKYSTESYNAHRLKESTVCSNMLYGNGNYYFLAGKGKKNTDYHSEVNDMTYFKGSSYQMYGNSDEILGYGQLGESLCVIKKNGSDNSMCLRTSAEISGLGTIFPVSYCLGGAALGVSADSIKNLNGEVLYLSQTGVKAVTSLSTINSKVTSDRSYYINGKLLKEENLKDAKCVIHKDKYYLGINGNVYILDASKPKDYINQTANEYSYEALFWDNVPASCFYSDGEGLYFGGKNGGLFKFTEDRYMDGTEPTKCFVATVFDDDGDFMSLKKLKKKGTGVLAKPYSRSTMEILYRYDDNNEKALKPFYPQYFDFNDIDFSRFTFYTSDRPQVIPFMKKSKKYKSFQFVLKSDADEPFAFLGIIKRYEIVNYVKRM